MIEYYFDWVLDKYIDYLKSVTLNTYKHAHEGSGCSVSSSARFLANVNIFNIFRCEIKKKKMYNVKETQKSIGFKICKALDKSINLLLI